MVKIKKLKKPQLSPGEELLAVQLRAYKIPFEREYKFHPKRKWRFDFWINNCIAVEVEGAPGRGRHTTYTGFSADCEKYNAATILGYRVLRYTTVQVRKGMAIRDVLALLDACAPD